MLIFIDDSGDPGFKTDKGSTQFFTIAMVIFDDTLEAEKTAVAIKELRRSLKFPDDIEFKFCLSSHSTRKKFLEAVKSFNFRVRTITVDKDDLYSPELKANKNSFYAYFIKMALKHNKGSIIDASIKIDGSGDKTFRKAFISYLRKELNSDRKKTVERCKLVDSKGNVLIQMADIIAGSIRRSYDISKKDHLDYRNIIKKHIEDDWQFH